MERKASPARPIHLLFAGEITRPDHLLPAPEIQTVTDPADFPVITLESLVLMKLMSNRREGSGSRSRHDRRPPDRRIMANQAAAGIGRPIEADPGHVGRLIVAVGAELIGAKTWGFFAANARHPCNDSATAEWNRRAHSRRSCTHPHECNPCSPLRARLEGATDPIFRVDDRPASVDLDSF